MRTGTYDLCLERPGLSGLRLLICDRALNSSGDLETAFLDGATDLHRHPAGRPVAEALRTAANRPGVDTVAVIRNPRLVLDPNLPQRLANARTKAAECSTWALVAAGGLGLSERRHLALYASLMPAIPLPGGPQPIVDAMPDLYLADAAFAAQVLAGNTLPTDDALETILTVEGYLSGRLSLFLPSLTAGIDGELMSRDVTRLDTSLQTRLEGRLPAQVIHTLSGPVTLSAEQATQARRTTDLGEQVSRTIADAYKPPSISIITRTRFERPHLLDRLLASIARARRDDMATEVVISTDVDPDTAHAELEALSARHPAVPCRLVINGNSGPSRVANLIGGLQAATNEYVAVVDDDDYLDLFAFESSLPAFFMGNRPLVVAASDVHQETWELPQHGRPVLARTSHIRSYPASGWLQMFSGVNALPVCATLMPRDFVLRRLEDLSFDHDLSEDYALFLLLLTAPDLPAVCELAETFCHISIRGTENSVSMPDRRPWVRDITGHLTNLTNTPSVAGAGLWALLARNRATAAGEAPAIAALKQSLRRRDADIRLLQHENARLRSEVARTAETVT